jgi:hypothetical protein
MTEQNPEHGERAKDGFMYCAICNAWLNPIYIEEDARKHRKLEGALKVLKIALAEIEV